jgi:hypothetical protein
VILLRVRPIRIGVAVWAMAALLALSMLPAEHLHASGPGRALVHRHMMDDGTEHPGSSVDHGDHQSAQIVNPAFDSQRQYDLDSPLIVAAPVLVAPEQRVVGRVQPTDAPLTHGPPIRVRSLRAPPA